MECCCSQVKFKTPHEKCIRINKVEEYEETANPAFELLLDSKAEVA